MEIQAHSFDFDATQGGDIHFDPGSQYNQPSAGTDGVSFRAVPRLKRVAATTVMAFGTASISSRPPDLSAFQHHTLVLPSALSEEKETLAERYSRLREGIVASGIAMLDDEQLRQEIRDRRGLRPETES